MSRYYKAQGWYLLPTAHHMPSFGRGIVKECPTVSYYHLPIGMTEHLAFFLVPLPRNNEGWFPCPGANKPS